MAVMLQAWISALEALLPPGNAFTRATGSVLSKVLGAIAAMLVAAQLKMDDLLDQADPRRATSSLPDWERLLGLPDSCTCLPSTSTASVSNRQATAYQRLVEQGGQSRAYFMRLAELLGEAGTTIAEFRVFTCSSGCNDSLNSAAHQFAWRVTVPGVTSVFNCNSAVGTGLSTRAPDIGARIFNCNSPVNSALLAYTPSAIECVFRQRKPAHTDVIFSYGE